MEQYIIPAVLALIVGLILWLVQRDKILLEYTIRESEMFPKDMGKGKYFLLNLVNNGNKAIENIAYKVELNSGKIESFQFSKQDLINIGLQTPETIQGMISLLNPNEELHTTITINEAETYSCIKLEARSVGVTAHESKKEQFPHYLQALIIPFTIAVVASTAFSTYTSFNQIKVNDTIKSIDEIKVITKDIKENNSISNTKLSDLIKKNEENKSKEEKGEPEREQIVFAILNKSGLSHILPHLLESSGNVLAYWKTGLFLIHSYLIDKKNADKYVNALSSISKLDNIASSSKGFLLYLAGKIEKEENNSSKAIYYFNICKKETPLMYEYMMSQDPAYDLKSIEKWLIKNRNTI